MSAFTSHKNVQIAHVHTHTHTHTLFPTGILKLCAKMQHMNLAHVCEVKTKRAIPRPIQPHQHGSHMQGVKSDKNSITATRDIKHINRDIKHINRDIKHINRAHICKIDTNRGVLRPIQPPKLIRKRGGRMFPAKKVRRGPHNGNPLTLNPPSQGRALCKCLGQQHPWGFVARAAPRGAIYAREHAGYVGDARQALAACTEYILEVPTAQCVDA
jgi:hypothetical protein